jgi:hypothetical protein
MNTPESKATEERRYGKQRAKDRRDEIRDRIKDPVMVCEACNRSEGEFEGHPKFMVCSVCRQKLKRKIYYCSAYDSTSLFTTSN